MHLQIVDLRESQCELILVVFVCTPLFTALCCALGGLASVYNVLGVHRRYVGVQHELVN